MSIQSIGLGWVTVKDLAKSQKFFETLGLMLTTKDETYGWLEFKGKEAGNHLGVGVASPNDKDMTPGQNTVLTFTVDDLEKTRKEFEAQGVQFKGPNVEIPNHVKMATFVDPDNNMFQIVQMLSPK